METTRNPDYSPQEILLQKYIVPRQDYKTGRFSYQVFSHFHVQSCIYLCRLLSDLLFSCLSIYYHAIVYLTHPMTCNYYCSLLAHYFIHPFFHSFVYSFIVSFHPFIHLHICSFIHPFIRFLICSSIYPSFVHYFTFQEKQLFVAFSFSFTIFYLFICFLVVWI